MEEIYVYRNIAVEYLFNSKNYKYEFSSYGDIVIPKKDYKSYIFFYMLPYKFDSKILIEEIKNYYERLDYIIKAKPNDIYYVFTLYQYFDYDLVYGDFELKKAINNFNRKIHYLGTNVRVLDIENFYKSTKFDNIFDMKYYYTYNCYINPTYKDEFINWFEEKICAYEKVRKKCLVVDLDNTLWHGVIGEDGISNVKMNGGYPGNCFNDFQSLILELKKIGIIICVASKNNKKDVDDLFKSRSEDMILKKKDFVLIEASWDRKDNSIIKISKELNISLDDIVFVDDNKAEQELIKQSLPEVTVLDFPDEPYMITNFFVKEFQKYFGINSLTLSDKMKTKQYKAKIKADQYKKRFISNEDYIKSLEMKIKYEYLNDNNIDRIAELINKSNQFNLTTKRYSKADLLKLKENSMICALNIKDKFDNLGIVAISIVKFEQDCAFIDNLLLSCRVIGRNIEYDFLKMILEDIKAKGYNNVKAQYIKSNKNGQVSDFYNRAGFNTIKSNNNETLYLKSLK